MNEDKIQKKHKEYSPEELELARLLEFYSQPFTLKSLATSMYATEEQVREYLRNLGLLQVVSKERVAERKRIHALARQFYADLTRATHEYQENMIPS